jgi:hypothetical protein
VSELKKGAIISDVELLTRNMHDMSSEVQNDSYHIDRWVADSSTKLDAAMSHSMVGGGHQHGFFLSLTEADC